MADRYGTHGAGEPSGDAQERAGRAFDSDNADPPGQGREVSDEERDGVSGTDTTGATPLGVGESINRHGEDVVDEEGEEAGRQTTGTQGERPVGTSDARSGTSVDPQSGG